MVDLVSSVLFPRPPPSYTADSFPGELLSVPRSLNPQTSLPEDFIPLLLLRSPGARSLFIFLHSNYEDLGRCRGFCRALRDELGVHVLAVEYPGYGICPGGHCDERGATENASIAFRFANEVLRWRLDQIILLGRSVGTGPAIALAVENRVGGLVLVSPFLSVREACRERLGPVADLIAERFPNQERMPFIRCQCLIIHGLSDKMVPPRHSEKLYRLCPTRKRLETPCLDHNASLLQCREHFVLPLVEFFQLPLFGQGDGPELQVPSWALDRRMQPVPRLVRAASGPLQRPGCVAGCPKECRGWGSPCSQVACAGIITCGNKLPSRFGGVDFVEDTIACAVEHILASGRDDSWGTSDINNDLHHRPAPSTRFRNATPVALSSNGGGLGLTLVEPTGDEAESDTCTGRNGRSPDSANTFLVQLPSGTCPPVRRSTQPLRKASSNFTSDP